MKLRTLFALLFWATALRSPAQSPLLADAARALEEKVPEVAVEKLEQLLAQNGGDRDAAQHLLVRALLAAERAEDASKMAGEFSDDEGRLLDAQALGALGRWEEAAAKFRDLAARPDELGDRARLGLADALGVMGQPAEAAHVLEAIKNPSTMTKLRRAELWLQTDVAKRANPLLAGLRLQNELEANWKKYLEARSLLARDQAAPALVMLEEIERETRGLTDHLLAGVTIAICDARTTLNGLEVADNVIEDFIWRHPQSPSLEEMFARIDLLYAAEENPSDAELQKWAQKPPRRRAALAMYYLARAQVRAQKPEKALRTLGAFVREYAGHPFFVQALTLQGEVLLPDKPAAAATAFEAAMRACHEPEKIAEIEIAAGHAHFKQREFLLAVNAFHDAAQHSGKWWKEAMYDSALAWLNMGNYEKFLDDYKALSSRFPESDFRRDLLLEEGLLQARSGDARAAATLQLFVRDFPDHPRVIEARLALAEMEFLAGDNPRAAQWLKVATEAPGGPGSERGDYLAIFVADAETPRADAKVISLCEKFLAAHGDPNLLAQVRMKLGQVYFQREDFSNAQTQFEMLSSEAPAAALAETALFLAGQAAMRSMNSGGLDHALDLFERVVKFNGPLKLYARQEEAIAKTRLGKAAEAIILYDAILRENPESVLRFAVLCGKADNLAASGTPDACTKAIAVYDQLVADAEVTRLWRNQALYKKAKCLEKAGDKPAALVVLYDVLQPQTSGDPEFFWLAKAGFDAARALEAQEKWESAIGIYEKLAKAGGPRSDEAKDRAEQLRLEHFIWAG